MPKILIVHAVLARSFPTDKFDLVKLLKKQGEIVAVTGLCTQIDIKTQNQSMKAGAQ